MQRSLVPIAAVICQLLSANCFAQSTSCSGLNGSTLTFGTTDNQPYPALFLSGEAESGDDLRVTFYRAGSFSTAIRFQAEGTGTPESQIGSFNPAWHHQFASNGMWDILLTRYGDAEFFDEPINVYLEFECFNTLPAEVVSFVAISGENHVKLVWETESETNCSGYEVQRGSADGTFEAVGFVDGAGTTLDRQFYEYHVEDLDYGAQSFRLKQIDLDGSFVFSDEVEVTVEVPETFVTEGVYPNPFNPTTTLQFAVSADQEIEVTLHDMQGKEVKALGRIQADPHETQRIQIDGGGLAAGTYLVRLSGQFFTTTERITLVK